MTDQVHDITDLPELDSATKTLAKKVVKVAIIGTCAILVTGFVVRKFGSSSDVDETPTV